MPILRVEKLLARASTVLLVWLLLTCYPPMAERELLDEACLVSSWQEGMWIERSPDLPQCSCSCQLELRLLFPDLRPPCLPLPK